ncbi:MAG TPA: hypothetical protein VLW17_10625 [Thermoanaerobaculaceae bacterium]|nr:hypothetical protein [Thermoanaerobaculaceae bacterium]
MTVHRAAILALVTLALTSFAPAPSAEAAAPADCVAPTAATNGQPNGVQVPAGPVTLTWTAATGTSITYRVVSGPQKNVPVCPTTATTSCTISVNNGQTIPWTVATDSGCGAPTAYSQQFVFTTSGCQPVVASQPLGQTILSGRTATLSVGASGSDPITYQWYQGNSGDTSMPVGTNLPTFTTPILTATTSYWVRVTNACGHTDSATATVNVKPNILWIPVASHTAGLHNSQWRSDLGLLNLSGFTANVQIDYFGTGGVASNSVQVTAGSQSILLDVVGQIPASGSGAIEVVSDQLLRVTARTYNQVAADADCYANGQQGQDYPALKPSDGLAVGQVAYLAGLTENGAQHTNIGLVNLESDDATVLVELFDGAGAKLTDYAVALAPGQWAQETQPFSRKAGQSAMDRGFAKITVQKGSGIFGFASVINNITNDPTTVGMLR